LSILRWIIWGKTEYTAIMTMLGTGIWASTEI